MTTHDAERMMAEALAALQRGDSDGAVAQLQKVARQPGVGGEPLLLLAAEWASLGRMVEAEEAFAGAILRSPELDIARFQLGLLQVSSGRPALGLLSWLPLRQLPSDNPLRCYVEGYAALVNDDFDEAARYFEQGLSIPQDNKALMADIRKTMAAVAKGRSGSVGTSDSEGISPDGEHHVLLSNYAGGYRSH